MRIVGLSGYAQSGKDTVAGFLGEHGWQRVAFADTLRSCLYALDPVVVGERGEAIKRLRPLVTLLGWDVAKVEYPEVRELLQRLGTDAGRNVLGENVWVDAALRGLDPVGKYVITDCRFPNEAEAVVAAGGEMWRVIRPGCEPVNSHPSETALDDWDFTRWIENHNSLDALRLKVERIVELCL